MPILRQNKGSEEILKILAPYRFQTSIYQYMFILTELNLIGIYHIVSDQNIIKEYQIVSC